MAAAKRIEVGRLAGKVIDGHSHIGISPAMYLSGCYPYCQSAAALLAQMDAAGVDAAISFPYGEGAYFDAAAFVRTGRRVPCSPRVSPAPYIPDNRLLCEEIYEKTPGATGRILPFLSIDPGRRIREQVKEVARLAREYPIYGLKSVGVLLQSSHLDLITTAAPLMRLAQDLDIPVLLHSTAYRGDKFSHSALNLKVARAWPGVRFCMAHCLGFDKRHLDEADALPNVWVDSAAMKIQIEAKEIIAPLNRRFKSDYSDYRVVFRDLARAYPDTMVWGTDAPAYTYIEKRRYPDGSTVDFALHGTYAKERAALDALRPAERRRVANGNTLRFLFGDR